MLKELEVATEQKHTEEDDDKVNFSRNVNYYTLNIFISMYFQLLRLRGMHDEALIEKLKKQLVQERVVLAASVVPLNVTQIKRVTFYIYQIVSVCVEMSAHFCLCVTFTFHCY